ncbi:winged helix-turn-helix transcriptional regulator [Spongiimicrobium salis]|uniref:winged helix-turn-helix transcriptional regulator n=1 Tax=Spongiimicrobium salis TaxID=1667022 RepID=UPI00374CEC06
MKVILLMKKNEFRSSCPISSALDLFGDKWSLLIVRDLLEHGERTFKDFSTAGENISSARLSERLTKLIHLEAMIKKKHPTNKKVYLYELTEKGKDLAPIIAELVQWSDKYLNDHISEKGKNAAALLRKEDYKSLLP